MTVAQTGPCRMPGGSHLRPGSGSFFRRPGRAGLLSDVAEDQ
jgi:hypothetical protein